MAASCGAHQAIWSPDAYAVDATTGAVRWTYPVELTLDTPPVAIGETVATIAG